MSDILYSDNYEFAFMPGIGAAVTTSSTDVKSLNHPSSTIGKEASKNDILFWGEDNDFPQKVIEDVRKSPVLGTLLGDKADLLYSGGLIWGIPDPKDPAKLLPLSDDENMHIQEWMENTAINKYLSEAAKDITWFSNAFVELVLNVGRTEIIQICTQAAEECRYGRQNPSSGKIDVCYINAQWPDGKPDDPFTKKVSVLDSYYNPAEQLRAITSGFNFIYPLSVAEPGNKFYQLASWNSIRESGWLAVVEAIPKFKAALLKNQMTIKYHIQISSQYWQHRYEKWTGMTAAERAKIKKDDLEKMEATLVGAEKAGKSLTSIVHHDFNKNLEYEMVKISVIDDKLKDGKYIEDGKEGSIQILNAVGLHAALTGVIPSDGLGGSGSNIREAYNLHLMKSKSRQDLLLEPLYVVKKYNKWNPQLVFRINNVMFTTLDKGKETKAAA